MNYESYDAEIVVKHRVRLVGWVFNEGRITNPGNLSMDDARGLFEGLIKRTVSWELVPDWLDLTPNCLLQVRSLFIVDIRPTCHVSLP